MNGEDEDDIKQPNTVILNIAATELIPFDAICRICGNNNGRTIGIYDDEGNSHELAVKMNMYLPIKVAETDELPLRCCWTCASTVLAWHEFVVGSVEADRKLKDLQILASKTIIETREEEHSKSPCAPEFENDAMEKLGDEWDGEYFIVDNGEYIKVEGDEVAGYYGTDQIEKSIDDGNSSNSTESRNRRRRIDIEHKIFCDVCKKGYTRRSDLERHRKIKHSTRADSAETKSESDEISCRYCGEKFETLIQLKMHAKIKHGISKLRRTHSEITAKYFCDVCQKGFTRNNDMKKHRNIKHPNAGIDQNEKNEKLKKLKVTGPDNRSYYKCDVCKKVFKYAYNMLRHQTTHTKMYGFVCHICAKGFPSSGGLRRHLNEHHYGVKKFSCEICGKRFAANATKEEHLNIHTNNRPFVCDICGKAFKQKASLRSHKLFHTNDFKFSCNVCDKRFRRAYELKTHTWTHTGHRPHRCPLCSHTFRLGQDLKRHLRVHDKLGECVCDECGATFSQQKYLNNHKRTHRKQTKSAAKNLIEIESVDAFSDDGEELQIFGIITD